MRGLQAVVRSRLVAGEGRTRNPVSPVTSAASGECVRDAACVVVVCLSEQNKCSVPENSAGPALPVAAMLVAGLCVCQER